MPLNVVVRRLRDVGRTVDDPADDEVGLVAGQAGHAFRRRLRMFPSLVNCCSIDWFRPWPSDALDAVASTFLEEVEMERHHRQSTVEMCKIFHESLRSLSQKFHTQERRMVYVTPTAYLELIQTFQTLLARKRREIDLIRKRYTPSSGTSSRPDPQAVHA